MNSMLKTMVAGIVVAVSSAAMAHCDTMDGPVVKEAQKALEAKDVTPVLKWVQAADEKEIKAAFAQTLVVREKGAEAKELADKYFIETLVRVHRAGEGQPYTGLKPAGTETEPGIRAADEAMESGSSEHVVHQLTTLVTHGVRQRFGKAQETAKHAGASVAEGRKAVAAYVRFMHYVEGVYVAASAEGHEHGEPATVEAHQKHAEHQEHAGH